MSIEKRVKDLEREKNVLLTKYEYHHLEILSRIKKSDRCKVMLEKLFDSSDNRVEIAALSENPQDIISLSLLYASRLVDLYGDSAILTTPGILYCKRILDMGKKDAYEKSRG